MGNRATTSTPTATPPTTTTVVVPVSLSTVDKPDPETKQPALREVVMNDEAMDDDADEADTTGNTDEPTALGELARSLDGKRSPALSKAAIQALQSAEPLDLAARSVERVYTWIDPSAGGETSDTVLLSVCLCGEAHAKTLVVLPAVSIGPTRSQLEEEALVRAHHTALRGLPCLSPTAENVVLVERNYGGGSGADRLLTLAGEHGLTRPIHEPFDRPGVMTTKDTTSDGVHMLQQHLSERTIRLARATNTHDQSMQAELCRQLGLLEQTIKKREDGMLRVSYSGVRGDNNDTRLDLAIALCQLAYWVAKVAEQEQYCAARAADAASAMRV